MENSVQFDLKVNRSRSAALRLRRVRCNGRLRVSLLP